MLQPVEGDLSLIESEWPPAADGSVYLNSGSCGRKPRSVLAAMHAGWEESNTNPTRHTFIEGEELATQARTAAAALFDVDPGCLLITNSTSQGLQLILQSFLASPGDELITTTHEHGITRTICRYLEEARGVVVHRVEIEPLAGSDALARAVLARVGTRTRMVMVSEIDCFSGWRPDLLPLASELSCAGVPFFADGAHSPGQGVCRPARYPLWVGSGHKWLGGPNGTGFAYVSSEYIARLKPVWLGDRFFNFGEHELSRFEFQGTSDVSRYTGLAAAVSLYGRLGPEAMRRRQWQLVCHLRKLLAGLPGCVVRTPALEEEATGMLTATFESALVSVDDLREALWREHRIWIQPDFFYGDPGRGMRISCHPATTEAELDRLVAALASMLKTGR